MMGAVNKTQNEKINKRREWRLILSPALSSAVQMVAATITTRIQ